MKKLATPVIKRVFPVNLGKVKSHKHFRRILRSKGMRITSKANDILAHAPSSNFFNLCPEVVLLTDVSVEELGLPDNSLYGDILYKGVREVFWENRPYMLTPIIPAHAIELRAMYTYQPKNEWLRCAMDGVEHPMGNKMIFRLVHGKNGVVYFDTDDGGDSDDPFDDHVRFIWKLLPSGYRQSCKAVNPESDLALSLK